MSKTILNKPIKKFEDSVKLLLKAKLILMLGQIMS